MKSMYLQRYVCTKQGIYQTSCTVLVVYGYIAKNETACTLVKEIEEVIFLFILS